MEMLRNKQLVVVLGAPRSGTTWLHHMIAAHPHVASINEELTLFSSYLAPVVDRFDSEVHHIHAGNWVQGLPLLYTPEEFEEGMRSITAGVYDRVLARRPEATHILDKHPNYSNHIPLIQRLLPGCRIIHIIRDGREVVVSMMGAKKRVGFGAGDIRGAAKHWARDLLNARRDGELLGPGLYMEVRYEELMADTVPGLERLFEFTGLPVTPGLVERIAAEHAIEKNQVSWADTSLNALRKKEGAIWKTRLSLEERWVMDRMVGDLLRDLGYADPGWWALNTTERLRMAVHPFLRRIRNSLGSLKHIWATPLVKPVR